MNAVLPPTDRGPRAEAVRPPASPTSARRPAAPSNATRHALQGVAVFEALKGAIVIAAGFGLLSLLDRDVRQVAIALVTRLHIDPERHYAAIFLDAAARVTDAKLWGFAAMAAAYAALRWVEAFGLWTNRRWAAWLGAASGGIYVPIEVMELIHRPSVLKGATLTLNLALVVYLVWTLKQTSGAPRTTSSPVSVPAAKSRR